MLIKLLAVCSVLMLPLLWGFFGKSDKSLDSVAKCFIGGFLFCFYTILGSENEAYIKD